MSFSSSSLAFRVLFFLSLLFSRADSSTPPRSVRIAGSQLLPVSDPAAPLPLWLPAPLLCPSLSSPTKVIMYVAFCLAEPNRPCWAPWLGWSWGEMLVPAPCRVQSQGGCSAVCRPAPLRVAHGRGAWPDFSCCCLVRTTPLSEDHCSDTHTHFL